MMATLIKNVRIVDFFEQVDVVSDVLLTRGSIEIGPKSLPPNCLVVEGQKKLLAPGLIDLHVHFREPGFTHKETISSGIMAALMGGVTSALVMPNTKPTIDNFKSVMFQKQKAKKFGFDLKVAAAASINLLGEQASPIAELKKAGAKAITDDGRPILDNSLMKNVLKQCAKHDLVCMQHAEDLHLSQGAPLTLGRISQRNDLLGQPNIAESSLIKRDIALSEELNARYHVLHLSCKDSLKLIKDAKRKKLKVSCEVTPHHLLLTESDIGALDCNKKMNPPLRSFHDRVALLEGLLDGSIDAVASDHAPHSSREKSLGFNHAPFGVVGVSSSILVLLSLVKEGLPLDIAVKSMTVGPARVLGEENRIGTMLGSKALKNAVLLDLEHSGPFGFRNLFGPSKNSAFLGRTLVGKVLMTFINGEVAFKS